MLTDGSFKTLGGSDRAALEAEVRRISAARDAWKAEQAAIEEAERAAFLAKGGVCWRCRDTGIQFGTLHAACEGEGDATCAAGERVLLDRAEANAGDIIAQMGLPERRRDQTLATFPRPDQPGYTEVYHFMETWDGETGLLLMGQKGRGKTGLLVGALKSAAWRDAVAGRRGQRITFTTDGELFKLLRDGYSNGQHSRHMERLQRVPLLGIDDLGTESATEWVVNRLFLLLNARYEAKLPTFATTNHSLKTLGRLVGMRVVDRLMESCELVGVGGVNLRAWLRDEDDDPVADDDGAGA